MHPSSHLGGHGRGVVLCAPEKIFVEPSAAAAGG